MDFSVVELPLSLRELLSKAFISVVVMATICFISGIFMPKSIPNQIRGIIGLVIVALLFSLAYEAWPYIPVIF